MKNTNFAMLFSIFFLIASICPVAPAIANASATTVPMPEVSDDGYLYQESFTYSDCSPIYDVNRSVPDPTGMYTSGIFATQTGVEDMSIENEALKITNVNKFHYFALSDYVLSKTTNSMVVSARLELDGNTFMSLSSTFGNTNSSHNLMIRFSGGGVRFSQPTGVDAVEIAKNTDGEHDITVILNSNNTFSFWFDGELLANNLPVQKNPSNFSDIKYICFKSESIIVDDLKIYAAKQDESVKSDANNIDSSGIPAVPSDGYIFEETFTYSDCSPVYDAGRQPSDPTGMYARGLFESYATIADMSIENGAMKITNPSSGAKWHSFNMSEQVMDKINDYMVVSFDMNWTHDLVITLFESGSGLAAHNLTVRITGSSIVFNNSNASVKETVTKDISGEHNIIICLNDDSTFSFWLDREKLADGLTIQTAFTDISTINKINFRPIAASGTVVIDNLRIYTSAATSNFPDDAPDDPSLMPEVSDDGYLYEETFSYLNCSPVYDENRSVPDPTGMYTSKVFEEYASVEDMSIENGAMKITNPSTGPNWHSFNMPESVMERIDDHMAVSCHINWTHDFVLTLFSAGNALSSHNLTIRIQGNQIIFNNSNADVKVTLDKKVSGEHDIVILLSDDSKFSFWLDNEKLASTLPIQRSIEDISAINKINFRPISANAVVEIDDLRVYTIKENSFFKADKAIRGMSSIEDITAVASDGSISSFQYDGGENVSITFEDSANGAFVNTDGSINFPLKDSLTDITVTVKSGNYTDVKTFKNVIIPAIYVFDEIIWPQAIFEGTVNEFTYIARARCSQNQPVINIVAVLYDDSSATTEIERLSNYTQSLDKNGETASGFVFALDLTGIQQIPSDALVKVFVWNDMVNMDSLAPTAVKIYDSDGQRVDGVQEQ